jgi:hypothetical protein
MVEYTIIIRSSAEVVKKSIFLYFVKGLQTLNKFTKPINRTEKHFIVE